MSDTAAFARLDPIDNVEVDGVKKHWPVFRPVLSVPLIVITALLCGFLCAYGLPGSVVAVPSGTILLVIFWSCRRQPGIWRFGVYPAALISWLGLLIDPNLLTIIVNLYCLLTLTLYAQGLNLRHLAASAAFTVLGESYLLSAPKHIAQDWQNLHTNKAQTGAPSWFDPSRYLLPLIVVAVFAVLLGIANHVMQKLLDGSYLLIYMPAFFWPAALLVFLSLYLTRFKPRQPSLNWHTKLPQTPALIYLLNPAALTATLVLLNGLFLVSNILDFQYVWLAGQLPQGLTHAAYVHRGAYALIVTAILAALLVVFVIPPKRKPGENPKLRYLVYLWLLQNLLLVASSIQRTLSYVEDYGFTLWRLSGLIWMGIVAAGLILVAYRMWKHHSLQWLVDANLLTCLVVVLGLGIADPKAFIANWNVTHYLLNKSNIQFPVGFDRYYLAKLGPSAIPALIELDKAYLGPGLICDSIIPVKTGKSGQALPFNGVTAPLFYVGNLLHFRQDHWQSYSLRYAYYQAILFSYKPICREALQ